MKFKEYNKADMINDAKKKNEFDYNKSDLFICILFKYKIDSQSGNFLFFSFLSFLHTFYFFSFHLSQVTLEFAHVCSLNVTKSSLSSSHLSHFG